MANPIMWQGKELTEDTLGKLELFTAAKGPALELGIRAQGC